MDALISAQAGTALLIQGTDLASIHAGAPERAIPRRAEEVRWLFGGARDLQVLEDVDRAQVVRRLLRESAATEALQLSLILLDSELPRETRREAAADLDAALAQEGCREDLERVLYAHPLPATADLSDALAQAEEHAPRVQDLLLHLTVVQPLIEEVWYSWIDLADALFASPAERQRLQAALVREGLFRELVLVLRAGTPMEPFLATALLHPALRGFQGYPAVAQAWTAPFRRHGRAAAVAERRPRKRDPRKEKG